METPEEGIIYDPETLREIRGFSVFVQYILKPNAFDDYDVVGPDDFGALILDERSANNFFKGFERDEWLL